jgi:hypothetical protein
MKRQTTHVQAHLLRGAFYLVLLLTICVIPFALAQRKVTKRSMAKLGDSLPANIIVVTNTDDSGPGSLRDALAIANDGDTIDATGVSGTILLTSGELQISTPGVTIKGPGAGTLAVNGNATFRVFENFAQDVTISDVTITNGVSGVGGGIHNVGGGVCCATLTVTNSTISGNSANQGGGILNSEVLTVSNSTISGNSANQGGGIFNVNSGPRSAYVTISNSTLSGNLSDVDGGGVYNSGDQTIFRRAVLSIENSTISGNSATGRGGGIANEGPVQGVAKVELASTILNAGNSGENIFNTSTVTSLGYNLSSDDGGGLLTGNGDQINTNPMLGPLQDNGGPTSTHELLPGSPAIDAGDPNFTPPPLFDQRGPDFWRVRNDRIDIGSFEVQVGSATRATPRPRPTPHPRPTPP